MTSSCVSSTSSDYNLPDVCLVCEKTAHGKHHGIISCRACAAFFRRSTGYRKAWKCSKGSGSCEVLINSGKQPCKKCRLEKCFKMGMTLDNFQFHRDPFSMCDRFNESKENPQKQKMQLAVRLPRTMEDFVGRPHMIIRCEQDICSPKKGIFDVNYLINKASRIFSNTGFYLPDASTLENLVLGLNHAWKGGNQGNKMQVHRKIGEIETVSLWESEFLGATKWMNRMIEFQNMPDELKMKLVLCIWYVWGYAQKLVLTADHRSKKKCEKYHIMIDKKTKFENRNVEFDFSWCSKYSKEQLEYFLFGPEMKLMEDFIKNLMEIEPTEQEQAFIILQICLNFAARKLGAEVQPYIEKMQSRIYDEIHQYYVKTLKMPVYSSRLAKLVKCDKFLQNYFLERKKKRELAKVFEIYNFESSHPEMFETVG